MIDRFQIAVSDPSLLKLNSRVLTDPVSFHRTLPDLRLSDRFDQRSEKRGVDIQLLPNRSLLVRAVGSGAEHFIESIQGTAPALLYGHNGRPLRDYEDMLKFLGRLKEHLMRVVDPAHHEHIIPGTSNRAVTYWSLLELHAQLADPDGKLLQAFQHARHPSIRNPTVCRKGTGATMNGKQREFQVYRKDLQMVDKVGARQVQSDGPVLRFELTLKQAPMAQHFEQACCTKFGNIQRVTRFTFEDLREVFLTFTRGLVGVYRATLPEKGPWLAGAVARIAKEQGLDVAYLVDVIAEEKGLQNKNYIAALKKNARQRLATLSDINAATLFNDEALLHQPVVSVPELEGTVRLPFGLAFQDTDILKVYASPAEALVGPSCGCPAT